MNKTTTTILAAAVTGLFMGGTMTGCASGETTITAAEMGLEKHACKIYAAELNHDLAAAHAIEAKIKGGAIEDGCHVRDIYRPGWQEIGRAHV